MTLDEIINRANSHRRGPRLRRGSTREELIAWLVWCDPNGCHTDEACAVEGFHPYTLEYAWQQVETILTQDD